jgi:hypothetical protein
MERAVKSGIALQSVCWVVVLGSVACGQVIDRILASPESERVRLIVADLDASAKKLEGKVLDATWTYAGRFVDANYGDDGTPPCKTRPSGKVQLISGQGFYWADYDSLVICPGQFDREKIIHKDGKTIDCLSKKGLITQVSSDCQVPSFIGDLDIYCDVTPCVVWRKGKNPMTPAVFQDFLLSCEWGGEVERGSGQMREIALKTKRGHGKHPRAGFEKQYRFAEMNGQLVHTGVSHHSVSPHSIPGYGEYDWVHTWEFAYQYQAFSGHLLPAGIHVILTGQTVNADGSPYKDHKPREEKNVKWKLTRCKILDKFPQEILQVSIPATVTVLDYCRDKKEHTVHRELSDSGGKLSYWWIMGLTLCCLGFGLLWYRRSRR